MSLNVFSNACSKAQPKTEAPPKTEHPAFWRAKPPSQWPPLVLTNAAKFTGHSELSGASAFLVESSRGVVVAATARHLLGAAGGVEPTLQVNELGRALIEWRLFPRTKPAQFAELGGIAIAGLDAKDRDWLVLSVKDQTHLPAVPLKLRRRPVEVGEQITVIGCPYAERQCVQNVYSGKVSARFRGDFWRFDIHPPVELPGFSGAPIVDAKGLVVGVTTIWFEPKKRGNLWEESGGEDVGAIYDAVEALR